MRERHASYSVLACLTRNLHKAQSKSIIACVSAIVLAGTMRSFAIAKTLKRTTGVRFKSGLQRLYRLMFNRKLDDLLVWSAMADYLLGQLRQAGRRVALVSLDWTEWGADHHVLALSLTLGRRAVPVFAQAFRKSLIPRSQNAQENAFVQVLGHLSSLFRKAILLADRGFRRASFVRVLQPTKGLPAVFS